MGVGARFLARGGGARKQGSRRIEHGRVRHCAVPPPSDRVVVFLHDGAYDRIHQGLSIAASAVATGRQADVYLFWWALERVAQDRLDEPDFGPDREETADRRLREEGRVAELGAIEAAHPAKLDSGEGGRAPEPSAVEAGIAEKTSGSEISRRIEGAAAEPGEALERHTP